MKNGIVHVSHYESLRHKMLNLILNCIYLKRLLIEMNGLLKGINEAICSNDGLTYDTALTMGACGYVKFEIQRFVKEIKNDLNIKL